MAQTNNPVKVCRLNGGQPILQPAGDGWESGVTFNAAAVFLRQNVDKPLIHRLMGAAGLDSASPEDLAAVLYRARPSSDPGYMLNRSRIGLALFDLNFRLIHRFPNPLLTTEQSETADDYLGVEDPRITWMDGRFVMVYCGCGFVPPRDWRGTLCTAESTDLLNWRKTGAIDLAYGEASRAGRFDQSYFDNLSAIRGAGGHVNNKDGALFPEVIDGWYYLLHRPMVGPISRWAIHLARSRSLSGKWEDLGPVMRALPCAGWADTWIGAGTVPMPLGDGRYLEIYHSGHRAADGKRLYTLGACVLDMRRMKASAPEKILEARLDHFLSPETRWEVEGPYSDSVANVVFACGAIERQGQIFILYGGGDTYIMAASVDKAELLAAIEQSGL
jgi:beta-1,2-mannobiose phosphorylase / 1,2-beta-oligomannan phosphorylase